MDVILNELPFQSGHVADLVDQSRMIIHANHNKTWLRPLGLLTDDATEVRHYLSELRVDTKTDAAGADKYLGYCWLPGQGAPAAIWVKPKQQSSLWTPTSSLRGVISTMAHETAHVLTKSVHGHVWRRAYALLLPLWLSELDDERPDFDRLRRYVTRAVKRYARRLHAYDQLNEVDRHLDAILRCKFYARDDQLRFYRP